MTQPVRILHHGNHHENHHINAEHHNGDAEHHNHQHHLTEVDSASNTEVRLELLLKGHEENGNNTLYKQYI